jgi:hypothetical protein
MLRTTTLLIVLLLSGGPAGALACELWCLTGAAESHHAAGCHDPSYGRPMGQQVASTAGCHGAPELAPLISEVRLSQSQRSAGPPALFQYGYVAAVKTSALVAGWSGLFVGPLRPSSFRAVLRV